MKSILGCFLWIVPLVCSAEEVLTAASAKRSLRASGLVEAATALQEVNASSYEHLDALMPLQGLPGVPDTACFGEREAALTLSQLGFLAELNCKLTEVAAGTMSSAVVELGGESTEWQARIQHALAECKMSEKAKNDGEHMKMTRYAMHAWGDLVMKGSECCNMVETPICSNRGWSRLMHALPFGILAVLLLLLVCTSITCCRRSVASPRLVFVQRVIPRVTSRSSLASLVSPRKSQQNLVNQAKLTAELAGIWMDTSRPGGASALRMLPDAREWATTSADLFAWMQRVFAFQPDSIRNQYAHLLSLWHSHIAIVADRSLGDRDRIVSLDERRLLRDALGEMHEELLEGFEMWRSHMQTKGAHIQDIVGTRTKKPPLAGIPYPNSSARDIVAHLSPRLAEVSMFLAIWGEAGNLRFMPELLYFITDLALSSESSADAEEDPCEGKSMESSTGFLAQIIRPIYNVVFSEQYDRIDIDVPAVEIRYTSATGEQRLLSVVEGRVEAGADVCLDLTTAFQPHLDYHLWLFAPVSFDAEGRRTFRIKSAANPSLCLQVVAGTGYRLAVQLQCCNDESEGQYFIHDDSRVLWLGSRSHQHSFFLCATINTSDVNIKSCGIFFEQLKNETDCGDKFRVAIIESRSGRDIKRMRQECEKFIPADVANYDDWNELFNNPQRLAESLVMESAVDGTCKLIELPLGKRFENLHHVNWAESLKGAKTHRELHSWWGVYASTHRIILLHVVSFVFTAIWEGSGATDDDLASIPIVGRGRAVCLSIIGILITVHALCWKFTCLATAGQGTRAESLRICSLLNAVFRTGIWLMPTLTYLFVRWVELDPQGAVSTFGSVVGPQIKLERVLVLHLVVCSLALVKLLFFPGRSRDLLWPLSQAPVSIRLGRNAFWVLLFGVKIACGFATIQALGKASHDLSLSPLEQMSWSQFENVVFSSIWNRDILEWCVLWGTGLLLYTADTPLWFTFGCTTIGFWNGLAQRRWRFWRLACEDSVSMLPKRFSEKVITYDSAQQRRRGSSPIEGEQESASNRISPGFSVIWDRIVDYFRYEDKLEDVMAGELHYSSGHSAEVGWRHLRSRLKVHQAQRVTVPSLFRPTSCGERCLKRTLNVVPDADWPRNEELEWRLLSLARGMTMQMPRPFQAPYIPGLTVLIPHYSESILLTKEELYDHSSLEDYGYVTLMSWIEKRYPEDFQAFTNRMSQTQVEWPREGNKWHNYRDAQWDKICPWASMRSQTLWRTVAGMTLYNQALDCHFRVQGDKNCALGKAWDPTDCFTCLVSMQMYAYFNEVQLEQTNRMLEKFPSSLRITFIDYVDKEPEAFLDNVHPMQQRRYFSCIFDKSCQKTSEGRRIPSLRVELPGFPILGDGKGDNQNHALPFTRGVFLQCIDANQGGYFEQMLLLPCVLGEFRNEVVEVSPDSSGGPQASSQGFSCRKPNQRRAGAKKIVGFPEHITSDMGSIGEFAASSEIAFGTVLQRAFGVLGGRMHYGHPDMMNKAYMVQQGGVSKATKTVNLSEDVFAGMDFTLRGAGRTIVHREYFHVAKGRDLGFSTVLTFFTKIAAGAAEQLLTRQSFRLCQVMPLSDFMSFYYAHAGYYLSQHIMSRCIPALMFLWMLAVADGREESYTMDPNSPDLRLAVSRSSDTVAYVLSEAFSWVALLWLCAQTLPLFVEIWMQRGFLAALLRFIKQLITLAPLHFIFQGKIIGVYVTNELRYGGAQYLATGRGLPIDRRAFISKKGGLYLDFAEHAFYDGFRLVCALVVVLFACRDKMDTVTWGRLTWWWFAVGLTICSWLFAPFVFNPYQFCHRYFKQDLRLWYDFMFKNRSEGWVSWFEKTQLRTGTGLRLTVFDLLLWALCMMAWYTTVDARMDLYFAVSASAWSRIVPLLPPVFSSLITSALLSTISRSFLRQSQRGNADPWHPAFAAAICVIFDAAEATYSLLHLLTLGWWKTVLAAVILKYTLLSCLLFVAQYTLRLKWCHCMSHTLRFWLYGHRLAMDFVVASLIFWSLSLIVLFDRVRDAFCSGCSLHQLLVFRDPGQLVRNVEEVRRFTSEASASNYMLTGSHVSFAFQKSGDSQAMGDHVIRAEHSLDRSHESWSRQRSFDASAEGTNSSGWSTSYVRRGSREGGDLLRSV